MAEIFFVIQNTGLFGALHLKDLPTTRFNPLRGKIPA